MEGRIRQLESILENAEIIEAPEPGVGGAGHDRHDRLRGRQRRRRRALPRRPHRGEDRRPRGRQPDGAARRRADRPPHRRLRRVRDAHRRPAAGPRSSRWRRPDRAWPPTAVDAELAPLDDLAVAPALAGAPELPPAATSSCPAGTVRLRELPGPPGAPTVVLLHGWTATADLNFFTCYEPLGEHFRVARLRPPRPRPRHPQPRGRSAWRTAPTTSPTLLAASASSRLIAVGYSMGGAVAQLLWRRHPEAVRGPRAVRDGGAVQGPLQRAARRSSGCAGWPAWPG